MRCATDLWPVLGAKEISAGTGWGGEACRGNLLIKAFTSMLNRKARSKYLKGRSGLPHAQILGKDYLGEAAQEFGRKFVLLSSLLAF